MSKKWLMLFFLFLLIFHGYSYGSEIKKDASPDYNTLVKQLKSNDKSVDFTALRYSYTKTADYNPYSPDDKKRAMFEALNNGEFEKAIKHAQAVLEKNYVDMDAHFVCRIAYRETKNTEKQRFHEFVVKGLLDSIYDSGNGQTTETAFVVISTDEEYFFLRAYGFNVIKQSLVKINDRNYDKIDVEERKSGEKIIVYFNVDMPFNWLNKQFKK